MPLLIDGGYNLELQREWGVALRLRSLLRSAGDHSLQYSMWEMCQMGPLVY